MSDNKGISLKQLLINIKNKIFNSFPESIWVKAEISSIKVNYSGHCYLELIDKDSPSSENVSASTRAIIWKTTWKIISKYFYDATGSNLENGMNVLLRVQIQYSELYGMSLIINDIDPSFTLGESEQKRIEVIARLKKEGMFEMNTELDIPTLPRKFAIISSETAAGYRDFIKHITQNEYGFSFDLSLFQAPMQGSAAPSGIIAALDEVMSLTSSGLCEYDAVLILRGGGSNSDLSCFDDYDLAVNVAQFPLPVFIAVGHDHDYHIVDMVARVSVKTPTALADFILNLFIDAESNLFQLSQRMKNALFARLRTEELLLQNLKYKVISAFGNHINSQKSALELLQKKIEMADPRKVLSDGYTLVYKNGVKQLNLNKIKQGDEIMILSKSEELDCIVQRIKINNK